MKPLHSKPLEMIELQECGSTNDEAWQRLQQGSWDGSPVIFTAKKQTNGRGRQGRVWDSTLSENLYASLLIAPPSQLLAWLPLAAGVAAVRSISRTLQETNIPADLSALRLKWPNDIMWGQKKGGGILCESRFSGNQCLGVVVGLGLNLTASPHLNSELETTSLNEELCTQSFAVDATLFQSRFLKLWCLDFLHWCALLDCGSTSELHSSWNEWAKLKSFPYLKTHAADGSLQILKALELDTSGKLKAQVQGNLDNACIETIYLDQALSLS